MKLRTLKKRVQYIYACRMWCDKMVARCRAEFRRQQEELGERIRKHRQQTGGVSSITVAEHRASMEALLEPNTDEVKPGKVMNWLESRSFAPGEYETLQAIEDGTLEYVAEKVSNGEVVDTFDNREDALALLKKHVRQKKAKLQIRNSANGLLELFREEEMA